MPASGISLVDANAWLALAFSDHVHHTSAIRWFDAQPDGTCGFCRLTQMALLRHLTNSKIMGNFVQSQQQAWQAYDAFAADSRVIFLMEPPAIEAEFRSLSQSSSRFTTVGRTRTWQSWPGLMPHKSLPSIVVLPGMRDLTCWFSPER